MGNYRRHPVSPSVYFFGNSRPPSLFGRRTSKLAIVFALANGSSLVEGLDQNFPEKD